MRFPGNEQLRLHTAPRSSCPRHQQRPAQRDWTRQPLVSVRQCSLCRLPDAACAPSWLCFSGGSVLTCLWVMTPGLLSSSGSAARSGGKDTALCRLQGWRRERERQRVRWPGQLWQTAGGWMHTDPQANAHGGWSQGGGGGRDAGLSPSRDRRDEGWAGGPQAVAPELWASGRGDPQGGQIVSVLVDPGWRHWARIHPPNRTSRWRIEGPASPGRGVFSSTPQRSSGAGRGAG